MTSFNCQLESPGKILKEGLSILDWHMYHVCVCDYLKLIDVGRPGPL